jgi:uncharacterized protein DUF4154
MALLRPRGSATPPGIEIPGYQRPPLPGAPRENGFLEVPAGTAAGSPGFQSRARRLALPLFLLLLAVPALLGAQKAAEYDVKAAFLYNFTKFVDWPPEAFPDPNSLRICVLGEDPFGKSLQAVTDEQVGSHKLIVTRTESLAKPTGCQVLFISRSERDRLAQILAAVKGSPVLTVGDTDGFANRGVMINFVPEGSKVRFEINTDSAERAGIKISSKLLQLAKRIVTNPGARPGP